jgi:hypothetical protein
MGMSNFLSWLSPKRRRADQARAELKANAEKALRMKQESDTGRRIPPHQTSNEGMHPEPAMLGTDVGREASFTPELKRSRVARSGDAS